MKKIVFIVFLFVSVNTLKAQVPDSLMLKLAGKIKLKEIMQEVDDFYKAELGTTAKKTDSVIKEFESDYLRWKRWEYYNASRLDEEGRLIPNINRKIYDGFKTYENSRKDADKASLTESSYSYWDVFGPVTVTRYGAGYSSGYGRVNCIAFHPTSPNTLIIGTPQGGIWKTTNNGASWFILSNSLPSNGISGLVWDRTNSNVIYALTGDGDEAGLGYGLVTTYGYSIPSLGVFKSVDGGVSWQVTGDFPGVTGKFYGYKLVQHPTNANVLFAATSNGIYKTTNGGNSWSHVQPGKFTDIEFKPGDPTIMYAAELSSSTPFWRTINSGDNWAIASSGLTTSSSRIAICVSANQPDYIYVFAGGATGSGSFKGLYRSIVTGNPVFTLRSNTPNILGYSNSGSDAEDQAIYDLGIEADPLNANTIIAASINIWKSTDGGVTYGGSSRTQWVNNVAGLDYVHCDIHNVAYNPINNYLYCVTDGGVGYSTNNGTNWTFIPNSLGVLASYHADWYEASPDYIGCGTQDNGTNIRYTNSNTYRHIYGGDGFDCVIKDNDPNSVIYVANSQVRKTTDGGITSILLSPSIGFFPLLARDFNSNTRIFTGSSSLILRSTDFGSTWPYFVTGVSGRVLTTCQSNSDRLYCSDGTTLQRSDNATTTLTFTTKSGTPGYPTGVNLTDLKPRPSNSLFVYASFGGYSSGKKVYASADGGDHWTNFSGSLPNVACHSIAVDANNTVYVGTDVGVFVLSTSMTDWQPFYNYLPRTPVSELMINNTAGRIIASTFGHGNFYSELYSTCPVNLNVTGGLVSSSFYEASSNIISTATAINGAGNKTAFKAGDYVRLDPGFEVKNGSELRAYINPCNTGGIPFTVNNLNDKNAIESLYVPAQDGMRFSLAKVTTVHADKAGAEIEIINGGNYAARVTDHVGNVVNILFTEKYFAPGNAQIKWDKASLQSGQYYIQLFRDYQLVHFQEFDVK